MWRKVVKTAIMTVEWMDSWSVQWKAALWAEVKAAKLDDMLEIVAVE